MFTTFVTFTLRLIRTNLFPSHRFWPLGVLVSISAHVSKRWTDQIRTGISSELRSLAKWLAKQIQVLQTKKPR